SSNTPAQAQNAIIGRYMRRSAARSAAGRIDELGVSNSSPIRNQNRPRNGIRQTAARAAHADSATHNGGLERDGSIENPHGITNSRRYRQITRPCDSKYASGDIPAFAPTPEPGMAAAANSVRMPIARATTSMTRKPRDRSLW